MTLLVQVVGFGAAALGLPPAADRLGVLDELAARGVVFVERAVSPVAARAARFPYVIESNSPARDFVAGLDPGGRFAGVLDGPSGRKLVEQDERTVPLVHVGEYLADLADEITEWLRGGAGRVGYGRAVRRIRRNPDGTFTSLCSAGRPVLRSRAVVLATGAVEDTTRLDAAGDRLIPSGRLLAGDCGPVEHAFRSGAPVVVVGGSHSGFAAADLLLTRFGAAVRPAQIRIVHRDIALGFPTVADLAAVPAAVAAMTAPPVVCPDTGAVNRFTGLRGAARRLCVAALSGAEERVRLHRAGTAAAEQAVAAAAVVVHAGGYRGRAPDLVDADGTPVVLARDRGAVALDGESRVLGAGGPVPGVHGLGIGFVRRGEGPERCAALNVFHGRDAEDIVRSLLRTTREDDQHGQSHR